MKIKHITFLVVLVLATLLLTFSAKPRTAISEEVAPEIIKISTPEELVLKYAEEYKVSAPLVRELITLENAGKWDAKLQSKCRYKVDHPEWGVKAGEYEKSFGLAQIHLPSHPKITYEQATDADFSIKFIASEISQGRGWQWSCYRTAKYNVLNSKTGGKCI